MEADTMKTWYSRTLTAGLLLAASAQAGQVCDNVHNPYTGEWEYQCVERQEPAPLRCRQEYDPMNDTWVTVCE